MEDEKVDKNPCGLSNAGEHDENAGLWEIGSGICVILLEELNEQKGCVNDGCRTHSVDDREVAIYIITSKPVIVKDALNDIDAIKDNEDSNELHA